MTHIPVDTTVPIACTAVGDEVPVRIEEIEHLRDRLTGIDRTPTGLLLRFDADPDLDARLRRFATDEKGCCRFWGFAVTADADELVLAWDGPPGAQELLDELDRCLRGDEPATALSVLGEAVTPRP